MQYHFIGTSEIQPYPCGLRDLEREMELPLRRKTQLCGKFTISWGRKGFDGDGEAGQAGGGA